MTSKNTIVLYDKTKSTSYLMILLIFLFISVPASTQTVQEIDLTTVNVDDLSDDQIRNYWQQAQSRGLSLSELEVLGRQRGVSSLQLQKLRSRIQGLSATSIEPAGVITAQTDSRQVFNTSGGFGLNTNENISGLSEEESKIFGFGLFKRSSLSFTPNLNLPTPVDYILGPGDELLLDLWGTTQQFFRFTISTEGAIRPPRLSPIYVNGLTIEQATSKIISRLSQIYSGLTKKGNVEPTIFYQLSLGKIRTINIEVVGAVERPGIYALPSLATVYTGIHASGGPTASGTFRNVRLIRNNKLQGVIDLYDFLTTGIKVGDERLQDGDVIIIPPYKKRVLLTGEVKTDGYFEVRDEESLSDILDFASGFNDRAYKELLTVRRNGNVEKEIFDVRVEGYGSFTPENGDQIVVSEILNRFANRVVIDGAVYRSGEYELTDSLTLRGLIDRAGGIRGDAYMQRATIYRTNDDFSRSTVTVSLENLLTGAFPDVPLQRDDQVKVFSQYDLKQEQYVEIFGEVENEGSYGFFNEMTIQDLIVLSGGLLESASSSLIEISRRSKDVESAIIADIELLSIDASLNLSSEELSHKLRPFDKVYIRANPNYQVQQEVTVEGEIEIPGKYTLQKKEERISELVQRARGLTPYAYPDGAVLIRRSSSSGFQGRNLVSEGYLRSLRNRIVNESSGMKTSDKEYLLELVKRIEAVNSPDRAYDAIGSRFKRRSIEDLNERDSLIADIDIEPQEIVAIDLDEILNNPGSKYDLILRPGDILSVPGRLETIRVAGEVTTPVIVRYDQSNSFKDYIHMSGGFLVSAKRGRSYVQYPNGERRGVKRFLWFKKYPKIEPGCTIFVSRKPEKQPLNFQAIVATAGSVATLALVVDRLAN